MPRPAIPTHVLALLVLVVGAVSVNMMMPAPPRCPIQVDGSYSRAASGNGKTQPSSPTCVKSLALDEGRFREP